jgi:phosphoglucosamine mutase
MSNFGFGVAMRANGIKIVEAAVGDRYVVEKMRDGGFNFGGEQSGHVIFLDQTTTGDGIIASLQLLAYMQKEGRPLSELAKVMKRYPQILNNIRVKEKKPFEKLEGFNERLNDIKNKLGDKGRVFVRYSGTEPIARVMIEGEKEETIKTYADELSNIIRSQIGS